MTAKPEEVELLPQKLKKVTTRVLATNHAMLTPSTSSMRASSVTHVNSGDASDKATASSSDDSNDTLTDGSTLIDMLQSVMVY